MEVIPNDLEAIGWTEWRGMWFDARSQIGTSGTGVPRGLQQSAYALELYRWIGAFGIPPKAWPKAEILPIFSSLADVGRFAVAVADRLATAPADPPKKARRKQGRKPAPRPTEAPAAETLRQSSF